MPSTLERSSLVGVAPAVAPGRISWRAAVERVRHPLRRASSLSCSEVSPSLQIILEGGAPASPAVVGHVEICLACQAELARYRRLLRLMHQLRSTDVVMPPGVVADVLSALEGAAQRRAVSALLTGRRIAYGSAVAAAVGTGAVIVVVARRSVSAGDRRERRGGSIGTQFTSSA